MIQCRFILAVQAVSLICCLGLDPTIRLHFGLVRLLDNSPCLQHSVRVARGLERRWHHIWLRSLEWQCLLEQWIHNPGLKVNTLKS